MDVFCCPNCGAEVPRAALICPNCGSDDRTGWSEHTIYDGMNFPGWDDAQRPLGFRDTLLWKDFKILLGIVLLVSFLAISFRY